MRWAFGGFIVCLVGDFVMDRDEAGEGFREGSIGVFYVGGLCCGWGKTCEGLEDNPRAHACVMFCAEVKLGELIDAVCHGVGSFQGVGFLGKGCPFRSKI